MPQLIAPTVRLRDSWLESRDEWGAGVHQAGAAYRPDVDDLDTVEGFTTWVEWLLARADHAHEPAPGWVHGTVLWVVEGDTYLGSVSLRHELNDYLLHEGGHIGYGIRPSARRRGLATWALGESLHAARRLGLARVLVTCDGDNVASARTIERNGGVLEDVRTRGEADGGGPVRRYWIDLS